jgi:hypothetical protein
MLVTLCTIGSDICTCFSVFLSLIDWSCWCLFNPKRREVSLTHDFLLANSLCNVQYNVCFQKPNSWTLRFPGITLRVLRLEVSLYNVYITNQFQTTFAQRGGGVKSLVEVTMNSKEENSEDFFPNYLQEFGLRIHLSRTVYFRVLLND